MEFAFTRQKIKEMFTVAGTVAYYLNITSGEIFKRIIVAENQLFFLFPFRLISR